MEESKTIQIINALFLIAAATIMQGTELLLNRQPEPILAKATVAKFSVIEELAEDRPHLNKDLDAALYLRDFVFTMPLSYTTVSYEYIGRYFITAYCPEECGWNGDPENLAGWRTASGEICHYSEQWYEPTTCAIDPALHSFGEVIAVGDGDARKIYITEDTGPGVKGRWVDCFVLTMDEVETWPTGFENVYRVEYTTHEITAKERRRTYELFNGYLHDRLPGPWRTGWHDFGASN